MKCAPILLLGFNRPDLIRQQIANIAPYKPEKLFFAVDGWRNEEEKALCEETKAAIELVDWPCELKTYFRNENRGCRNAPPEAITWFFNEVESGIVLEDDCHPAPGFIRFATELLERYKDDERIGAIAAFNRHNLQSDKCASYHFSKDLNVWGWASWHRVWKDYDVTMKRYIEGIDEMISSHTKNKRMRKYWHDSFKGVLDGAIVTWDYQFSCMFMMHGYLCVRPKVRLVANKGIGVSTGTHTCGYDFWAKDFSTAGNVTFPLAHPSRVEADVNADEKTERIVTGIVPWVLWAAGSVLPRPFRPLVTFVGRILYAVAPKVFEL